MKGYYYSKVPPKWLDDTLDGYPTSHDGRYSYEVYRHIEGNWYLYFRYES